ncbi:hypothetical protein DSO57_1034011 [Entomophthora muscae]|uniref:Uncharacterized protein n=1 Tax=Entomophthora muscae TaxID=34485 RepID=A0ACC2S272_9FUNG|nr:hypothetical protein DSO57_1034011 [Entomophthora muscae]
MSSFNNNQLNKLFPGLDTFMQGYAGSLDGEASVYGHSQPAGPSLSTTQECVLSPVSSRMALFAHHAQAAANPNHIATLASRINQVSHGAINGSVRNPFCGSFLGTCGQTAHRPSREGHHKIGASFSI